MYTLLKPTTTLGDGTVSESLDPRVWRFVSEMEDFSLGDLIGQVGLLATQIAQDPDNTALQDEQTRYRDRIRDLAAEFAIGFDEHWYDAPIAPDTLLSPNA